MRKESLLHKYFRKKEKLLYSLADRVGCMSKANIEYILKKNPQVPSTKVHLLPNWQVLYQGKFKNFTLKQEYNLQNRFVVVFGGNMGKPQQLENVIALAKECEVYTDVVFLIFGEGVQKRKLEELVINNNIHNIQIHKTIPKDEYQNLLSVCDVGLISLHKNFTIPNIPSKSLDYFNVGLPILASLDSATDFNKILEEYDCGLWSLAGETVKFKENFDILYRNPQARRRMGENGRAYFKKFLTPDKAFNTIIEEIEK